MYNPEITYRNKKQHLLLPGVALNKLEPFLQKRKIEYSVTEKKTTKTTGASIGNMEN